MVTIKDGCGCGTASCCSWKDKLEEAYKRAIQSVNKIGDNDGSVYFPDGTGFVKLPLPKQSDVAQIHTNTEDIVNLKARDIQLQADINAETTAREEAITAEASAREAGITAEASAREAGITAEASAREAKDNQLDADIARIDNTDTEQDQKIKDNAYRINYTYNELVTAEATIATHNSEIITLQANNQALTKSLVNDVLMTDGTTAGSVQVSIKKEDGALITSANYKWGRDIGVRLEAGTQAGYIKTVISLSDGTELESNEYKIVEVLESDVYVTAITLVPDMTAGTIGGNISYSNGTTQTINSVSVPTAPGVTSAIEALQSRMTAVEETNNTQGSDITALTNRVQALEDTPGIEQFAAGKLGTIAGSGVDGKVAAENDGTGSVNGWSDLKSRVSAAEEQIVAAQNNISALDGTVAQQTTDISGLMTDVANIRNKDTEQDTAIAGKVAIDQGVANAGKALIVGADGNLSPGEVSGGGEVWEELDLSNLPTDFANDDRIKFVPYSMDIGGESSDSWTSVGTIGDIHPTGNGTISPVVNEIIIKYNSTYGTTLNFLNASLSKIDMLKWEPSLPYKWNSSDVLYLTGIRFNGAFASTKTIAITRSNIGTYIYKIWRLKK